MTPVKHEKIVSILIAEDDENIALALKTIVDKAFNCEKLTLVYDGDQAWEQLQKNPYDLIVSDWNMPGMTGQELLEKIRSSDGCSNTPFLMLTARADKTSVLVAIQAGANDYISKPYQKDQLIEKIDTLLELSQQRESSIDDLARNSSNSDHSDESQDIIQIILDRFKHSRVELPVMPHVYTAVSEAMDKDDADVDVNEIVGIIETEPSFNAALITISNSSFYRGAAPNKTLEQAISRIGLEATKQYVFMIEGCFLFKTENRNFTDIMQNLWQHSLATAVCAREIAQQLNLSNMDILFTMGLLHDFGKLPLLNILIELAKERDDITNEVIATVFEALHAEIGEIILSQWQFPEEIVNIAKYHHDLSKLEDVPTDLLVVDLANILVRTLGYSLKTGDDIILDQIESAKLLQIDVADLEKIQQMVVEGVQSIKT